nr:replication protein A 70 kDa DNA-binding subunit B-like [Ipomoea batatas]
MEKFASAALLMLLNCFSMDFHDLKKSYNSNLTPLRCIDSAFRLSGANLQLGEYWVAGQNVGVESVVDWYYISCKNNSCSCKRKVTENGGMMYCGSCKSSWHEGVVRYKVLVRVAADESGDVPMLIWDRECEESVGLLAGLGNKSSPLELASLRGMSMFFRILMKKDQVESDLQR